MYGNPTLGQWVRQRRAALGLTQEALAARIDCSLSLVRKLERGERRPPPDALPRLLDLLGAGPAERAAFLPADQASPAPVAGQASRPPGAVPAPPNRLIGRDSELAAVVRRLADGPRLLTICGAPGIGKTRLAQHAAADLLPLLDGTVTYVALAPVAAATAVPDAIAAALGLRTHAGAPVVEQLADHLHPRRALLVLDNCEHVLDAAPLLATLLEACPRLRLLATSREPLRLRAEQLLPLAPLALPESPDLAAIARAPAARLLADRARALNPGFALDEANAPAVAAICARLDGLPLAIELAAARLDQLSPAELLARLDPRLPALTNGPRDLPARQRTLRDAIAWSYDLLEPAEHALFAGLGVFIGGFTAEAAAAVCDEQNGPAFLGVLSRLVDASMVQQRGERFHLLETLREFALERLEERGELEQHRRRYAASFAELAERAAPELSGAGELAWFERLEPELPNLRAAIDWSLASDGGVCAARIGAALLTFYRVRGHFGELRVLEAPLLAGVLAVPPAVRAAALYAAGFLASQQNDPRCYPLLEAATVLSSAIGDARVATRCLNLRGLLARVPGSYAMAVTLHEQALALARTLEDQTIYPAVLNNLGMALTYQSRFAEAIGCYEEAISLARAEGHQARLAERLPNLAEALLLLGDTEAATARYGEGLAIARALGHRDVIAECLDGLGLLALLRDDHAGAAAHLAESLAIYEELGLVYAAIRVRRNLGYLALRRGDSAAAEAHAREALRRAVAVCKGVCASGLPNYADLIAHSVAVLARAAQLTGEEARAVALAGCAEALRRQYGLRAEPGDAELRAALAPLAEVHSAAWANALSAPTERLIATAMHSNPDVAQ